jgi:hypothetical protein
MCDYIFKYRISHTALNMTYVCLSLVLYVYLFIIFPTQNYFLEIGYLTTCHLILDICMLVIGIVIYCNIHLETYITKFIIANYILGIIANILGFVIGGLYIKITPFYINTIEINLIVGSISLVLNFCWCLIYSCPIIYHRLCIDD